MQYLCRNRRKQEGKRFTKVYSLGNAAKNSVTSLELPGMFSRLKFVMADR